MENLWYALGLTVFAGLSTGIGSAVAFFTRRTNYRVLSVATGFSAGVMLYVSFVEILPKAARAAGSSHSARTGDWLATLAFFGGVVLILLIDRLVPSADNPHEVRQEPQFGPVHNGTPPQGAPGATAAQLHRMGLFTALAIAIHNFPEGLATFVAALDDPTLGLAIAVAVALHNIPEGISVSVPIYFATGNRRRAFAYSLLSGLAEPAGGLLGYLALRPFLGPTILGVVFGAVAGIMVYISLDELLPTSRAYGRGHDSIYGLLAGMAVMALSLLLIA